MSEPHSWGTSGPHDVAPAPGTVPQPPKITNYNGESEFARIGANLVCRFLESRGWDTDRIHLVEEAIVRHTNLVAEEVPVYRLVQAGAAVDVAGLGREEVEPDDLAGILKTYPRLDFVSSMRSRFLDEIRRHPQGAFPSRTGRHALRPIRHRSDRRTGSVTTSASSGGRPSCRIVSWKIILWEPED